MTWFWIVVIVPLAALLLLAARANRRHGGVHGPDDTGDRARARDEQTRHRLGGGSGEHGPHLG